MARVSSRRGGGHPGLPLWTQGSKPLQSYHGDRVTKS